MSDSDGGLSLRRNFSWTTGSNIIYAACQWGVVSVLAKIGDSDMLGRFALALAIVAPIDILLRFQMKAVQATDAKRSYLFSEYLALRLLCTALTVVIAVAVAMLGYEGQEIRVIISLVAIGKAFDSIADIYHGAFQQRERMDIVGKTLLVNGPLSLALLALGVWGSGNLTVGVVGYVLGSVVSLLVVVLPNARRQLDMRIEISRSRTRITQLLLTVAPLGVVVFLNSLASNAPRYFLEHSFDLYTLGVFAALSYLLVTGSTVVDALGQVFAPRLSRLYAQGDFSMFRKRVTQLMAAGLAIGMLGFVVSRVFGEPILRLLYTSEYVAFRPELEVLSLGAGVTFAGNFAGVGLTAARRFMVQAPRSVVVTAITFGLSALLIPIYGLMGAAVAIALSALVRCVLSYWLLTLTWKSRFELSEIESKVGT